MRNEQIAQLALVLSDLSDIGHINSSMNFVNVSGQNFVNVIIGENVFTISGSDVRIFNPPKILSLDEFLENLIRVANEEEVFNG